LLDGSLPRAVTARIRTAYSLEYGYGSIAAHTKLINGITLSNAL